MSAAATPAAFDAARRFAWLRLWRSENIGPRTFQNLLARFGSAERALEALPDLLARTTPGRAIRLADAAQIERELEAAERIGARFICRDEPGFPAPLREIDSPPAVLCVRGRVDQLERPAIAIVGSRNASAAGLAFADRLARGLAQSGYVIVSGFARGIDSRAHRASLSTGTIAVLPGGLDRVYPADQAPFLEALIEDGAAISEMPFGWEARGRDFPRRNRLVAGLSLGVIVVEAARRSGSLITARFAADEGREVFAVPGSPLDPRAEGTNDLIRDGASFCASVDDVIRALAGRPAGGMSRDRFSETEGAEDLVLWDELDFGEQARSGPMIAAPESTPTATRDPVRDVPALHEEGCNAALGRVTDSLGPAPVSIDELARAVDLPIRDVRTAVLELEIAGRLERHGGGLISLIVR